MELSAANDAIRLVTASAGAVHAQAGWADETVHPVVSQAGPVSVMPGRFAAVVTTAATTTLVSAPGGAVRRRLTALHVANRHATDANAVSVEFWDGAAAAVLYKRTLAAGESLSYAEGRWVLYDAAGVPVGVGAQGPPGPVKTSGTPAVGSFARFTDAATIEGRTPADARADLGLVIGTNVQAYDADLTTLATAFATAAATTPASLALAEATNNGAQIATLAAPAAMAANVTVTLPDATTTLVGTDATQTLSNKTLTTPTVASFANAAHAHADAAGGGQITDAALSAAVGIAKGGTGQTTAQAAINALTAVAAATNEHVLTKDTTTGNAVFKAGGAGGGGNTTLLGSLTSISTAVSGTTAETKYDRSYTFPAGSLAAGDVIWIRAEGGVQAAASASTALFRLRLGGLGGALIGATAALSTGSASGVWSRFALDQMFYVLSVGATGQIEAVLGTVAWQRFTDNTALTSGLLAPGLVAGSFSSPLTVDTTAAQELCVTVTHGLSGLTSMVRGLQVTRLRV